MTDKQAPSARSRTDIRLSVVVPAYNEANNLRVLYEAVRDTLDADGVKFELVFAENGSADDSLTILRALHTEDPRVNYVGLSRNFGSQGGLIAGMEACTGDAVVTMDADLQHPPSEIPRFLDCWEQGYDIVNTRRANTAHAGRLRLAINAVYFWIMAKCAGIDMNTRQSDFRLFDRMALEALIALPERDKFIRGLTHWVGFKQTCFDYEAQDRHFGETKYRFFDLVKFALNGITSFSVLPLHFFSIIGVVVSASALFYALVILLMAVIGQEMPSGFASLGAGVFFLGGVQLFGIGVLGEYIGKIIDEARGRPTYIVRESSLPHAAPRRRNQEVSS